MELYDTETRTLCKIKPMDEKILRFYCCGPTVYGPAHIGNFRTFVLQDVFRRVVELNGISTQHLRNLTDVDDKTIRDSRGAGMTLADFTQRWTRQFHSDCLALNCLLPHVEPSAVEHIPEQIAMVQELVKGGYAYAPGDGSVYFKISACPDYGKLSHLDSRELDLGKTANVRANTDEYEKDSVADFVLWKGRREEDGENFWSSPWGEGRPGWHLECSAMIYKYFGKDFDLHSGGVDLVFPHHENELAQSTCAYGGGFARHWFHITHLLVDGGKMSKSLGNMYTLADLQGRGFTAAALRYVLAGGYYRRPLNFTLNSMADATAALSRLAKFDAALEQASNGAPAPTYAKLIEHPLQGSEWGEFLPAWEALNTDLNTPEALGHVFTALRRVKPAELTPDGALSVRRAFRAVLESMGLMLPAIHAKDEVAVPVQVRALADRRLVAKQAKDWSTADVLRKELKNLGWLVKDTKDGYELEQG